MDDDHLYDPDQVDDFLRRLYFGPLARGDHPSYLQIVSTQDWSGRSYNAADPGMAAGARDYITTLHELGAEGIYARVTTMNSKPYGGRGGADLSYALPGLWADIDIAGPGHKDGGLVLPLPADEVGARTIVEASGLPLPTMWVHSGGGLYPWWLLIEPDLILTDGHRRDVSALASQWQAALRHAAQELGVHYGSGVGDLSRVLRIPGTVNRKIEDQPRPCRIVSDDGPTYNMTALWVALADTPMMAQARTASLWKTATPALSAPVGHLTPNDDFEARVDWSDPLLLGGLNWVEINNGDRGERRWLHPQATSKLSATTTMPGESRDRMYVFSDNTIFPVNEPISKVHAYAIINNLNASDATRDLLNRGYGDRLPTDAQMAAELGATPVAIVSGEKVNDVFEGRRYDGLGFLETLVAVYGTGNRYVPERKSWMYWDGARWTYCGGDLGVRMVGDMGRIIEPGAGEGAAHMRRYATSPGGLSTLARLLVTQEDIHTPIAFLDQAPWRVNTPEGPVDLRQGTRLKPDPADLFTRTTGPLAGGQDCPKWEGFLSITFGGDNDMIGYVQRLVGMSITGMQEEQVLPFLYGNGANGKSVFIDTLRRVLGDYATGAPSTLLFKQAHRGHETEVARLAGARMVVCSELNDDEQFDEARVKMLTGGDLLTARFMYRDHFTFSPTHQLWLMGNHRPHVQAGGDAFWRRVRLIEFGHTVPVHKRVPGLARQMASEESRGIFNWIVEGAVSYADVGLRDPEKVLTATAEYARSEDSVGQFVEERCRLGGGEHVKTATYKVRDEYMKWCAEAGEDPVSKRAFSSRLRVGHGISTIPSNGRRFYTGLSLVDVSDD